MNSERNPTISRLERLQAMVAREAERVERLCANDRPVPATKKKGKKAAPRLAIVAPPTEQIANFALDSVRTEKGQVLGQAYRRQPHFETLHRMDLAAAQRERRPAIFDDDAMRAMRFYRAAFEGCERSETKCALNILPAGSSRDLPPSIAVAKMNMARCEADMGPLVEIMRLIVLRDMTYQQVAMARFGSRDADWYDDKLGRFATRPAPKSTRHTAVVKQEFLSGLALLLRATRPVLSTERV